MADDSNSVGPQGAAGQQPGGGFQGSSTGATGSGAKALASALKVRQAIMEKGMMTMEKAGTNHAQALQMTQQAQHFGGKGRLQNATFDVDTFQKQQLADKLPELFGVDSSDRSVHSYLANSKNIAKAHDTLSEVLSKSKANEVMQAVAGSQQGKQVAGKMGKVQLANTAKNLARGNLGDAAHFDHMSWMNGK